MRPRWGAVPVTAFLLGGLPGTGAAQDGMLLRYRPSLGTVVHTVTWIDMTVTIGQSAPDQVGPESLTIEVSELESLTETVRPSRAGGHAVEVTFDSVRTRVRPRGGAWQAVTDTMATPVTATMLLDERRQMSALTLMDPAAVRQSNARRLRSFVQRMTLALPEEPVAVDAQWTADVSFPVDASEALAEMIPMPALDLRGWASISLDSVVDTTVDMLAYLRFNGVLAPPGSSGGLEAALRITDFTASFAGVYVWSTGWNAYVSGATRLLLGMTLLRGTQAGVLEGMAVGVDALYRYQVRP